MNLIINVMAVVALATKPASDTKQRGYIFQEMILHSFGRAILQIIILFIVAYAGDHWYPEPEDSWRFDKANSSSYVYPGRRYDWDGTPLYLESENVHGYSRHYTNVFNILVIMELFYLLSVRTINDEKNIFQGIFNNKIFTGIWLFVVAAHAFIIEFGSDAFKVSPGGLNWQHWLIALAFGVLFMLWDFLLKLIPVNACYRCLGY